MRRPTFMAAIAALALVLAPTLADAAAGRGSSQGSRGSRTQVAPPATNTAPRTAAPMQRTTQPATPAAAAAAPSRGMFGGGLMSGLMGGLLGAGLIGMMMGGGFFSGMAGFMGFLGLILQVGLVALVVVFAVRWFRRRNQPAMANGPMLADRTMDQPQPDMMHRTAHGATPLGNPTATPMGAATAMPMGAAMAPHAGTPVAIGPEDYQAFEGVLQSIQGAWSAGNEGALREFTTPEMAAYFGEQLSDMERQGLRNEVSSVKLEQGDLAEAWGEHGTDYATVAMRFSAIDVTRDRTGLTVEGDATNRSMITEIWTFARRPGEPWVLSAIQQAA